MSPCVSEESGPRSAALVRGGVPGTSPGTQLARSYVRLEPLNCTHVTCCVLGVKTWRLSRRPVEAVGQVDAAVQQCCERTQLHFSPDQTLWKTPRCQKVASVCKRALCSRVLPLLCCSGFSSWTRAAPSRSMCVQKRWPSFLTTTFSSWEAAGDDHDRDLRGDATSPSHSKTTSKKYLQHI